MNCVIGRPDSFSNLLPCYSGTYTEFFCCGGPGVSPSCCDESFRFFPGLPYVAPGVQNPFRLGASSSISSSLNTQTSSSYTSTSTFGSSSVPSTSSYTQTSSSIAASTSTALFSSSTPTPTPSAHTTFQNATAIEVGIGVPLGLLLLLCLGFLLYQERQRRDMIENLKREHQTTLSNMWQQQPRGRYPLFSDPADIQELENTHPAADELDPQSGPIYEVAAKR